ncbi:MAG: phage holin family protein [Candidatus Berkelbacteria bacterium]
MGIIVRWVLNALVLFGISYIVPGVYFANFYAALILVVVLGIINAIIKPILVFFTLPINILTLGLFTLVINGLLFLLASTIVKGFVVTGFWPAFFASLVFSLVSTLLSWLDQSLQKEV